MKRMAVLAVLGLGVWLAFEDTASARSTRRRGGRSLVAKRYAPLVPLPRVPSVRVTPQQRLLDSVRPTAPAYQNPLVAGSTPANRLRTPPAASWRLARVGERPVDCQFTIAKRNMNIEAEFAAGGGDSSTRSAFTKTHSRGNPPADIGVGSI